MNLDLTDDQTALRDTLSDFFENEAPTHVVRAAEPLGFVATLWSKIVKLGLASVAVPEEHGGGGGGFVELAIAAELLGRSLAPVPLIEAAVATTLLASLPTTEELEPIVEAAVTGELLATIALHPAGDVALLVPAGAVADIVVVRRGDELVVVVQREKPVPAIPNLGAAPIATCAVPADAPVLASGSLASFAHRPAVAHWRALTGVALVGLGHRALEIGLEYVLGREAFGAVIGSFQTIQHRLADDATALEGARLLAKRGRGPRTSAIRRRRSWRPWRISSRPRRPSGRPPTACTFTAATATPSTTTSSCTSGGPRRGGSPPGTLAPYTCPWLTTCSTARRPEMDFWEPDEVGDHRDAVRAWADANVRPEWAEEQDRSGCHQTPELHARLARDGILAAGWPSEYGGSDVDPNFARAVFDECARRGLRADGWASTAMVIHTIEHVGTEEQKRRFIGAALRGEMLIALGYSEPDCGSDAAAARTAAVRDGSDWVINGQKMFTSTAQVCSHVFVLTRTNTDVPKHQGLTLFLVPTGTPGYDRQPIYTLGGQVTNATYYTDVHVDDSVRIGGIDDGWSVMNVALVYERGVAGQTSLEQTLAHDLAAWSRQARREDGSSVWQDPLVAERIGRMAVEEEVTKLMGQWLQWRVDNGHLPGVEGSMRKLFYTEADQRRYSDALDILGVEGLLAPGASGVPGGGKFERDFRDAVVTTVYGGTSEILRDIIAQRGLGLPRTRRSS